MVQYQKIWDKVLAELKNMYEPDTYDELFSRFKKVNSFLNNYIYVIVEEEYIKNRINKFCLHKINDDLLMKITNENVKFKFVTKEDMVELAPVTPSSPDIDLDDKYRPGNLDATYNFQNFVVGKSNHFACTMSLKIADQPGAMANPLYIFGGVGLGKTHLMQAIGNFILDKDINQKILYVEASKFSEDYATCCSYQSTEKQQKLDEFHRKYRDIDVLLVDDIQILCDRTATQEEFFKLFNILYQANKQIVITCDRPATSLKGMVDRLTNRFSSGLIIDIGIPDLNLRVNILKKKIQTFSNKKDMLSDEVLNYIASYFTTNIRELEGALKRVIFYSALNDTPVTLELAAEALDPLIDAQKKAKRLSNNNNSCEDIQSIVSAYYNITVSDLIGTRRSIKFTLPRHIAMYIIKEKYDLPYKKIGSIFNNRDHSTVLSACEKISNELKTNAELKMAVDNIKKKIKF